ncbi:MAG TPA: phosphoribosylaminoimidazolesuccinocarboxamide synthase [Virgibacillus sp.]|nr:phosphoribosylaminoimidazolesuccinocarboxamide synthase [Virgibacillus sp.]
MELIYKGKTKDVYRLPNGQIVLQFKDHVTGAEGVFDPGANTVGLTLAGAGRSGLRMTKHFFDLLSDQGIPTHFIAANLDEATMTVKDADMFGHGLEVICRYKAVGSFIRRYGAYCEEGQPLDAFFEVTIKDDKRQDPPISKDALVELNIITAEQYTEIKMLTKKIAGMVKYAFADKNLDLYDLKLEFGRDKETGSIMLIDEISAGNMRVFKDDQPVGPLDLEQLLLG